MNEELATAIERLLIDHPAWVRTNTPPRILATYLARCLDRFESALLERAEYFGRPTGVTS